MNQETGVCAPMQSREGGCETGIRRQFVHPAGALGWLVGHVMAIKNRSRGEWVVSLLELQPTDRVLEIGFGPGVDVRRARLFVTSGLVAGVDPSHEMLRQARVRNGGAGARVDLRRGTADALPFAEGVFDKVFASNSVQFWPDLDAGLVELRRVLRPGGRAVIAIQPRSKGATADTTVEWGRRITQAMIANGFSDVHTKFHAMRPVPAVAVIGLKSARRSAREATRSDGIPAVPCS